ncbi:MAG: hypothetical protein P0116_10340 [Candidatus Nitrosocosmicus sp.]|nr:hypothetical protein [Candidatus Nitrosocosmicus sp.]
MRSIPSNANNTSIKNSSTSSNNDDQKTVTSFEQNTEINPQSADNTIPSNNDDQKTVTSFGTEYRDKTHSMQMPTTTKAYLCII